MSLPVVHLPSTWSLDAICNLWHDCFRSGMRGKSKKSGGYSKCILNKVSGWPGQESRTEGVAVVCSTELQAMGLPLPPGSPSLSARSWSTQGESIARALGMRCAQALMK